MGRVARMQRGTNMGSVDDPFLRMCAVPVSSQAARCGAPWPGGQNEDENAIRGAIQASAGGYAAVDRAAEEVRLAALARSRDALWAAGLKDSQIMAEHCSVIEAVSARFGPSLPMG